MPQSLSEFRGLSNIRGQMVLIIDLKVILQKEQIEEHQLEQLPCCENLMVQ